METFEPKSTDFIGELLKYLKKRSKFHWIMSWAFMFLAVVDIISTTYNLIRNENEMALFACIIGLVCIKFSNLELKRHEHYKLLFDENRKIQDFIQNDNISL